MHNPFFIVGSVRSGTTLLRDLFKQHPDYVCPEETHIYRWCWPFGTAQYNQNYLKADLFRKHQQMDGISPEVVSELLRSSHSRGEFLKGYVEAHKRSRGVPEKGWFEKTPQNIYGLMLAAAEIPELRFINIIRNPLNVVASLKKGVIMKEDSIVGAVNYWREAVLLFDQFKQLYPDRCLSIYYEDLTESPKSTLGNICAFLAIHDPFLAINLGHVKAEKNQYLDILTDEERELVRKICQPVIEHCSLRNYFNSSGPIAAKKEATVTGPVAQGESSPYGVSRQGASVVEDLGLGLSPGAGHYRAYVGPPENYDVIAAMVFNLLTVLGLRQHHRVIDIGCGSLRLGRILIPYLNRKNYVGVEANRWLVEAGIRQETGQDLIDIKQAAFHFSFDLNGLVDEEHFDYAIFQSIFSHTSANLARQWLKQIAPRLKPDGAVLATFVLGKSESAEQDWVYPDVVTFRAETVESMAKEVGLQIRWLNWDHPSEKWALLYKGQFKAHWFWGKELTWNERLRR